MENLRMLSDRSLISETKTLVQEERRLSLAVLHHLREIERRRLFASLGFSSLYEYATQELGYSEASAHRRIQASRLLAECPELAPKIESGSLSLSVLCQAQTFFRREEIQNVEEKRTVLKTLEKQSSRQAERKLLALTSEPEKHRPEKVRPISETHSEVRFTADPSLLQEIEELQGLLGQSSVREVIAYAVKRTLEMKRPKAPTKRAPSTTAAPSCTTAGPPPTAAADPSTAVTPPTSVAHSRYIPAETRRLVWARDLGQCSYQDSKTGQRCQSRFGLQFDHLKAFALGGSHEPENLALKCRAHNDWAAIQCFGHARMARRIRSLR